MADIDVRRELPLHVSWLLGLVMIWFTWQNLSQVPLGVDSHAYWAAWRGDMYDGAPGTLDAYLYSPAFAQAIWPLAQLPWPAFGVVWALASVAGLLYLFAPMGRRWLVPMTMLCAPEIVSGNVFWLLALVAALGLRHPSLWAVAALTKVTPALGPLWFAVRREWRNLGVSVAATAAVVALSYGPSPSLWEQWVDFLLGHASATGTGVGAPIGPPLVVRLPLAIALLVATALKGQRWGLPVSMALATPVSGVAALTVLAALPRLLQERGDPTTPSASAAQHSTQGGRG